MDLMLAAERERAELADLLQGLSPQEWEAQSLCADWTVREVVALRAHSQASPDELLHRLRQFPQPTGLTAAMGGAVGLVDALIHQQDIRRPLNKPRAIDPDPLRFALKFTVTAPPLRGFWKVRGVRVIATDVNWSHGRGAEVRGPGEAVLMAMAGRSGAADDLSGPGRDVLKDRFG